MMKIASYVMMVGVVIQVTAFSGHKPAGEPAPTQKPRRALLTLSTAQFIIGRVVTGLGNGANTATIPSYHAETSPSKSRGLLVCIEAAMISTGTAIAYW